MRLFSYRQRPVHLGPYPLERLARQAGVPDLDAVAPMQALYDFAVAKNIAVVFLTGRPVSMTDVSEKNLKAAGFAKFEQLILKPATPAFANLAAFKTDARKRVTELGFTIVANVGDQQSDLDGGFAERTFKVPNPFYYNP